MISINYKVRKLEKKDITPEYFQLLQQLSIISLQDYCDEKNEQFYNTLNSNHQIYIIEDLENHKIIGSGTIWMEPKLIRNYGKVAHLEDIVIDKKYRGLGLGKKILEHLLEIGKNEGCYKCVLSCEPGLLTFYQNLGFIKYGKHLRLDF